MTAVAKRVGEDADLGLIRAVAHEPVLSLAGISAWSVCEYWPKIEVFIERLADQNHSVASLRRLLEHRKLQLWVGRRGHEIEMALLTEICDYPLRRSCILRAFAVDNFTEWLPHLHVIETWARSKGCKIFEVYGRPGSEREFRGWPKTHIVLSKEL